MSHAVPSDSAGERLESWKEIAAYLKRDVRTARRWEKLEGLPVHRHVHHKLASVYAYKPELDGWRANRDAAEVRTKAPDAWRWSWRSGGMSLAAVLAIAIALVTFRAARQRTAPAPGSASGHAVPGRLLAGATGESQRPTVVAAARSVSALVLSPDGKRLYFTERENRTLHVLETSTNRISHSVSLPTRPNQLAVSPDGQWGYAGTEEGDVLRLDLERRTIETLARGLSPVRDLALTPDGLRLYVAAVFNGLHVLDTRTRQLETIPTVRCPTYLAIVPGKDLLYVAYQCGGPGGRSGHDAIDVRSAASGKATATISGPPLVGGEIHSSPDGAQIWADGMDACVSPEYDHVGCPVVPGGIINIYRTDDNYLLTSLGLPGEAARPGGISFFRDGSRAIVGGPTLKVIDVRSLKVVEEAPLSAFGRAAFTPDGQRAYVALPGEGRLAVFDFAEDRCVSPPAHLAAWWSGDGHANDVREDTPGELRTGAGIAPAWVGQGFQLDGRGAHVHAPNLTTVDVSADFSVAVWMKPATAGRSETILYHGHADGPGWNLKRGADGLISFCLFENAAAPCSSGPALRSHAPVRTGVWTHVVAVVSGHRLSVFLDGELSSSTDFTARPAIAHPDFRIGGPVGGGTFYAGLLDEVQLFREALSTEDVRGVFGAGRFGLCYR